MAGKCEWVKDNCLKNLQVKKKELEKYVDKHAAKMTSILSHIEKEETNIKFLKEKISENEKKINSLEEENEQLSFKSEQSTFMLSNLQAEKIDLEKDSDKEVFLLQTKIRSLELQLSQISGGKHISVNEDQGSFNNELLEYLEGALKQKEEELECPVCLETAEVPIFMCNDSHLVCNICLEKLQTCPECRKKYPRNPKRHRYAEKLVDEKEKLKNKISSILNNAVLASSLGNASYEEDEGVSGKEFLLSRIPYNTSENEIFSLIFHLGPVEEFSFVVQSKSQRRKKRNKCARIVFKESVTYSILHRSLISGGQNLEINLCKTEDQQRDIVEKSVTCAGGCTTDLAKNLWITCTLEYKCKWKMEKEQLERIYLLCPDEMLQDWIRYRKGYLVGECFHNEYDSGMFFIKKEEGGSSLFLGESLHSIGSVSAEVKSEVCSIQVRKAGQINVKEIKLNQLTVKITKVNILLENIRKCSDCVVSSLKSFWCKHCLATPFKGIWIDEHIEDEIELDEGDVITVNINKHFIYEMLSKMIALVHHNFNTLMEKFGLMRTDEDREIACVDSSQASVEAVKIQRNGR